MGVEVKGVDDTVDPLASKSPINRTTSLVIDHESNVVSDPGSVTSRPAWIGHLTLDRVTLPIRVIGSEDASSDLPEVRASTRNCRP